VSPLLQQLFSRLELQPEGLHVLQELVRRRLEARDGRGAVRDDGHLVVPLAVVVHQISDRKIHAVAQRLPADQHLAVLLEEVDQPEVPHRARVIGGDFGPQRAVHLRENVLPLGDPLDLLQPDFRPLVDHVH